MNPFGQLLLVRSNLGLPMIIRVESVDTWVCIAGPFRGYAIQPMAHDKVLRVLREGDVIEGFDALTPDLVVHGGELEPM